MKVPSSEMPMPSNIKMWTTSYTTVNFQDDEINTKSISFVYLVSGSNLISNWKQLTYVITMIYFKGFCTNINYRNRGVETDSWF